METKRSDFSWKLPDHLKLPKGKTIAMVVLDGWGESTPDDYNCIHKVGTVAMDSLKKGAPDKWRLIKAHDTTVGLPSDDDMGNSEVGHNALGEGEAEKATDLHLPLNISSVDQEYNGWPRLVH